MFLGIIEDLQRIHNEKVFNIQNSLENISGERNNLNYVDERMGTIKNTIEEILSQSKELKIDN